MKYLEEGKNLNLNCLIGHQQNHKSQIEARWHKKANKENVTGFGREIACTSHKMQTPWQKEHPH